MASDTLRTLPIRLRTGGTIHVPPLLGTTTTYVLLEQEAWFESEVDFVRTCLRPGDCAIDVGANFGVYTIPMAQAVGPAGKIFAFEPSAGTAAYLRASVELNHGAQVEVIQAAVSDHPGEGALHLGSSPEESTLAVTVSSKPAMETVKLTTLDAHLAGTHGRRIALIKLDAEGHELQVGRGARELLARDEPVVLFEIRHGSSFEFGFLAFLQSLGWSGYRLTPGMNMLVPFDQRGAIDPKQLNLFACSPKKASDLQRRGLLAIPSPADLCSPPLTPRPPSRLFSFGNPPAPETAYGLALAHYASAHEDGLDSNRRMGHMWQALHHANQAVLEKDSLARRVTFARIAADLGNPIAATSALQEIIGALTSEPFAPPNEPCLPPAEAYVPGQQSAAKELLRIGALETFDRLRAYSSLFMDSGSLPLLEYLCRHPLSSPEMHRRRQLLKITRGLQAKPEPESKLIQESPDNLNAWFWRGAPSHNVQNRHATMGREAP